MNKIENFRLPLSLLSQNTKSPLSIRYDQSQISTQPFESKRTPEKGMTDFQSENFKQRNYSYLEAYRQKTKKSSQEKQRTEKTIPDENLISLQGLEGKFSQLHSVTQLENKQFNTFTLQNDTSLDSDSPKPKHTHIEKDIDYYRDQNAKLKRIIIQIKIQTKSKVVEALRAQKTEIKHIMDQYKGFIDQLMTDKKNLTKHCEELQNTLNSYPNVSNSEILRNSICLEDSQKKEEYQKQIDKLQAIIQERQEQMEAIEQRVEKKLEKKYVQEIDSMRNMIHEQLKMQDDEFNLILGKKEMEKESLEKEIIDLKEGMSVLRNENNQIRKVSEELDAKFHKLETLVEEMEIQKNRANLLIENLRRENENLKIMYENQIRDVQKQNEIEFERFEEIVRETIQKKVTRLFNEKDDCIDRLNGIISGKLRT